MKIPLEGAVELLEELEEIPYPWEAEFLTDSEWWDMCFDIVSRSFSYILGNDFLRLFVALSLLIVVVNLMGYAFRVGRRL